MEGGERGGQQERKGEWERLEVRGQGHWGDRERERERLLRGVRSQGGERHGP
jgi:hypothetical protein